MRDVKLINLTELSINDQSAAWSFARTTAKLSSFAVRTVVADDSAYGTSPITRDVTEVGIDAGSDHCEFGRERSSMLNTGWREYYCVSTLEWWGGHVLRKRKV